MNIAVSTTDGKTICGHLGKCRSFIIFETDGKEILGRRTTGSEGSCPSHGTGGGHNVSPFAGCHAVITQGMGQGMLDSLAQSGIQPVITSESDPDTAVMKFLKGELSGTTSSSCTCGDH